MSYENNYDMDLKIMIIEIKNMIELLVPNKTTLSYICNITGKKRQTVNSYLERNFTPGLDYWKKRGKIEVSKKTAIELIRRYNAK
ncbi:hypothetical protein ACKGJI_04305 [Sulfurospirillum sp. 1307]|jgi:hypothetical protein